MVTENIKFEIEILTKGAPTKPKHTQEGTGALGGRVDPGSQSSKKARAIGGGVKNPYRDKSSESAFSHDSTFKKLQEEVEELKKSQKEKDRIFQDKEKIKIEEDKALRELQEADIAAQNKKLDFEISDLQTEITQITKQQDEFRGVFHDFAQFSSGPAGFAKSKGAGMLGKAAGASIYLQIATITLELLKQQYLHPGAEGDPTLKIFIERQVIVAMKREMLRQIRIGKRTVRATSKPQIRGGKNMIGSNLHEIAQGKYSTIADDFAEKGMIHS